MPDWAKPLLPLLVGAALSAFGMERLVVAPSAQQAAAGSDSFSMVVDVLGDQLEHRDEVEARLVGEIETLHSDLLRCERRNP